MRAQWDATINRVWSAILTIAASVLVATLIILSGIFLKWLLGVAVGPDTLVYAAGVVILDFICVPCAVIWAVNGVVIVGWEALVSIKTLLQQTGEQQ